jgi:polyisoprenoid-binding protein YceI
VRGSRLRALVGIAAGVVLVGGGAIWWYLIRDDAPPEARLVDRTTTTGGAGAGTADGTWSIVSGGASFVGFRIAEHLPGIDNTAVMRTAAVEGELTVDGAEIPTVTVSADLTRLESKDAQPPGIPGIENRARQMRDDGLETSQFPTATFVLTAAITLEEPPTAGRAVEAEAVGDLTIHGVTREVAVPVEARWSGEVIDVAGSLDVALSDFGMTPPERRFVTVAATGTMELQLAFRRA